MLLEKKCQWGYYAIVPMVEESGLARALPHLPWHQYQGPFRYHFWPHSSWECHMSLLPGMMNNPWEILSSKASHSVCILHLSQVIRTACEMERKELQCAKCGHRCCGDMKKPEQGNMTTDRDVESGTNRKNIWRIELIAPGDRRCNYETQRLLEFFPVLGHVQLGGGGACKTRRIGEWEEEEEERRRITAGWGRDVRNEQSSKTHLSRVPLLKIKGCLSEPLCGIVSACYGEPAPSTDAQI